MPERDTLEFTAAVVLGTFLGAGLTYLLRGADHRRSGPRKLLARDETSASLTEVGKRILTGVGPWKDRG